jgi:predicted ATPase
MSEPEATTQVPRLTYLRIRNYRALRDVELRDLTPLTVLVGPNGSGKSTVLDALAFLAEAVSGDLRKAWEDRNRFAGMRTRGSEGDISFELEFIFENKKFRYTISFYEMSDIAYPQVRIGSEKFEQISPTYQLSFEGNKQFDKVDIDGVPGWLEGKYMKKNGRMASLPMSSKYASIGSMAGVRGYLNHPLTIAAVHIRSCINNYRYIHFTDDHATGQVAKGPREWLSANGDNLPNVLYYLQQKHPEVLKGITQELRRQVPVLAEVLTEVTSDERLLLRFRDAPFEKPLSAQYMSEGTLRLTALLTLLREPRATELLGLEEPEQELYPRLLPRLAEELSRAAETRQLLVTTHAPALLTPLEPAQVWILHRGTDGYTQATCVADLPEVVAMVEEGSPLGYLWARNFFDVGDPLSGFPAATVRE